MKDVFTKLFWIAAWRGLKHLALSASLITTSGVTIYHAINYVFNPWQRRVYLLAAGIIAVFGAWELICSLAGRHETKATKD